MQLHSRTHACMVIISYLNSFNARSVHILLKIVSVKLKCLYFNVFSNRKSPLKNQWTGYIPCLYDSEKLSLKNLGDKLFNRLKFDENWPMLQKTNKWKICCFEGFFLIEMKTNLIDSVLWIILHYYNLVLIKWILLILVL